MKFIVYKNNKNYKIRSIIVNKNLLFTFIAASQSCKKKNAFIQREESEKWSLPKVHNERERERTKGERTSIPFNMANHDKGRRKWGGISQGKSLEAKSDC